MRPLGAKNRETIESPSLNSDGEVKIPPEFNNGDSRVPRGVKNGRKNG